RTPEEAWPLVQILAKPALPTVVVGLGEQGVMLTVLARKMGAPWSYAALERGMEAYPGQPTIHDLQTIYRHQDIERGTRLLGVTGVGQVVTANVALLNAAMVHLGQPARCLPLAVGNARLFRKVLDAVRLNCAVVDEANDAALYDVATEHEATARQTSAVDLLLKPGESWQGYQLFARAAGAAL